MLLKSVKRRLITRNLHVLIILRLVADRHYRHLPCYVCFVYMFVLKYNTLLSGTQQSKTRITPLEVLYVRAKRMFVVIYLT